MHVACSGNAAAPDAGADAFTGNGLSIELVAKNGVPQMPTAGVEITQVVIGATAVRAIGDSAPGDARTTRENYAFEFRDDLVPIPIGFRDAPPGLYSTITLHVEANRSSADAVAITGRAIRSGTVVPFEIRNTDAEVAVAVPIETMLVPRGTAAVTIEVDVGSFIADVDWATVPLTGDGRLYIGDGDPEMADVMARIAGAFAAR